MAQILRSESSLQLKQDLLRREAALLRRLRAGELIGAAAILVAGLILWLFKGHPGLLWLGGFALFIAIGHTLKMRENESDADKLAIGSGGEEEMSQRLARGLPDDTFIVNDIMIAEGRKTAQVDHFVISPRGIFVVETKNWGGRLSGSIDQPNWKLEGRSHKKPLMLRNPIWQNRRQTGFVRRMLLGLGLDWPDVVPMVAMVSPQTRLEITGDTTGQLFTGAAVVPYIRGYAWVRNYSREEIDQVLRRIGVDIETEI